MSKIFKNIKDESINENVGDTTNMLFLNNLYLKTKSNSQISCSDDEDGVDKKSMIKIKIDDSKHLKSKINISKIKITLEKAKRLRKADFAWVQHFPGQHVLKSNEMDLIFNKFVCHFDIEESFETFFDSLRHNIFVFIFDLTNGTIEDSYKLLSTLRKTKNFLALEINNPIQYSGISLITQREPITGLTKLELNNVHIKKGDKIIITADRRFAIKGSKNVIYINCIANIKKLMPNDYIYVGPMTFRVIEQTNISAMCEIICSGYLKSGMPVKFPKHCTLDVSIVTQEEIDDIKFSQTENINCIILPTCDCDVYLCSIKHLLKCLNFNYCRLFATVYAYEKISNEHAKLISQNYDGICLNIYKNFAEKRNIIKLPDVIKYLIEQFYLQKKPILVGQFFVNKLLSHQTIVIDTNSRRYLLDYPDKIILKVSQLKSYYIFSIIEIYLSHKYYMIKYARENIMSKSNINLLSESEAFAKSAVKAAFDTNAKCIILSSKSGRMPIHISHYRPNIPIIVLLNNSKISHFLTIYDNIWSVYYHSENAETLNKLNLKQLICGLIYARSHNMVTEEDNVIYLSRSGTGHGYPNKILLMKITHKLLEEISH